MSPVSRSAQPATQFRAEKWTTIYALNQYPYEQWTVIMVDGDEAGQPCALGGRAAMEAYAKQLNESKGVLP